MLLPSYDSLPTRKLQLRIHLELFFLYRKKFRIQSTTETSFEKATTESEEVIAQTPRASIRRLISKVRKYA